MANVFGILTFIVLGLASFVAYKNKEAFQTEITNTQEEKVKLAQTRERLKIATDTLAATLAKRLGIDADCVKLTEEEANQNKTNADLKSQIQAKTSKSEDNKAKLDVIREKTARIGDLKELASKMRQMNEELVELGGKIDANTTKLAGLTAQNTQAENHIAAMKKKFETINKGESLPILKTRIRSIYPTWGFVTLGSGNSGGVVPNSTLDVMRDGACIAKLLVTAVESNSASASIIPDSISKDVTLMVGDRVVPAQKAETPAKKSETPAKTPAKTPAETPAGLEIDNTEPAVELPADKPAAPPAEKAADNLELPSN